MLKTSYLSQTNAYKHDTDRDLVYSFDREREREREREKKKECLGTRYLVVGKTMSTNRP